MVAITDKATSTRKWALVIGIGLALYPIHNLWLTNLLSINGKTVIFLPAIGAILWIMGSLLFIVNKWDTVQATGLGDKRIWIPLLVIVASMGISGFVNADGLQNKVAPLFMGIALFATYIAARNIGADLFRPLIPFVVLGAIISIVIGVLNPGIPAAYTNGLITNYCMAAGFMILGTAVNQGKWQWILVVIALVGVFFVGAVESLFILLILGATVLVRKDFSKKLLVIAISTTALVGVWGALGYLTALYKGNGNLLTLFGIITDPTSSTLNDGTLRVLTSGRWEIIVKAMQDIRIFGHGLSLSTVGGGIVHNIPLIIVHQIGPVAGIAWLFVSLFCLVKTKWKYTWIAVLAMCIWDHYLWTQWLPIFWVLVGVSTTSTIKNDLIFRKDSSG